MAKTAPKSALPRARGPLDQAAIVEAALTLLEEAGLEGFTTRRLGRVLGISGPSLYWHFKSKTELLDQMAGALLLRALPPPDLTSADFDWRAWLLDGARGMRRVALSVRDGAKVLAASRPPGPGNDTGFGAMVATLQRSGLSEADSRLTLRCLGRFAISWVLYEQTVPGQAPDERSDAGFEYGLETFALGLEARLKGR